MNLGPSISQEPQLVISRRAAPIIQSLTSHLGLQATVAVIGDDLYDQLAEDPRCVYLDPTALESSEGYWDALVVEGPLGTDQQCTSFLRTAHAALSRTDSLLVLICPNDRHLLHLVRSSANPASLEAGLHGESARPALPHIRELAADEAFEVIEQLPLGYGYTLAGHETISPLEEDGQELLDLGRRLRLAFGIAFVLRPCEVRREPYATEELERRLSDAPETAVPWLLAHIERQDGRSPVWSDAAVLHTQAEMWEEALLCARRAVTYDPWNDAARENIQQIREELGSGVSADDLPGIWELSPVALRERISRALTRGNSSDSVVLAELLVASAPSADSVNLLTEALTRANQPASARDAQGLMNLLRGSEQSSAPSSESLS